MISTGFADVPVTRSLVYTIILTSILVSVTDSKHLFYIQLDPHLLRYHQLWRMCVYQLCYTNSTEVFFGAMTWYNMRVVERLWGRPTSLIFAVLAQYHAIIPHQYKYKVAATANPSMTEENFVGITFSDKSYIYLPAVQLCLSQFPGSLISAVVGWVVGYLWRNDVLPAVVTRWRLPGWMVGVRGRKRGEGFEGMRRRLEGENSSAVGTGVEGQVEGEGGRRRTLARQFLDQFSGP
ncbi:uba domain-containing ucp14 protein [Rutstroemia sp. NJR-2017a WRK4]|nr:uba domain-containing ucp14 protein [Rutstroemia sp. NJR-2017a WRK4]